MQLFKGKVFGLGTTALIRSYEEMEDIMKIVNYSKNRQFYGRIIAFYKIFDKKAPQYLIGYLPTQDLASINLTKKPATYLLDVRTERYCNCFFPYCISEWNILDSRISNLPSIVTFKRIILYFIRPVSTPLFKINRLLGFVFLIRLRVGFSYLREH